MKTVRTLSEALKRRIGTSKENEALETFPVIAEKKYGRGVPFLAQWVKDPTLSL